MIRKFSRVFFGYKAGGQDKIQFATVARGPYKDEDGEEVVDLDCDGWAEKLIGTPVEGLELVGENT